MNQIRLKMTQNGPVIILGKEGKDVMEILKKTSFFRAFFCPEKFAPPRQKAFPPPVFPQPLSPYGAMAAPPRRKGQAFKAQRQRDCGVMAMRLRRRGSHLQPKTPPICGRKTAQTCNALIVNILQTLLRMAYLRASHRPFVSAQKFYKMF